MPTNMLPPATLLQSMPAPLLSHHAAVLQMQQLSTHIPTHIPSHIAHGMTQMHASLPAQAIPLPQPAPATPIPTPAAAILTAAGHHLSHVTATDHPPVATLMKDLSSIHSLPTPATVLTPASILGNVHSMIVQVSKAEKAPRVRVRRRDTDAEEVLPDGEGITCSCGRRFANGRALGGHRGKCKEPRKRAKTVRMEEMGRVIPDKDISGNPPMPKLVKVPTTMLGEKKEKKAEKKKEKDDKITLATLMPPATILKRPEPCPAPTPLPMIDADVAEPIPTPTSVSNDGSLINEIIPTE